jgi:hypothetical protein
VEECTYVPPTVPISLPLDVSQLETALPQVTPEKEYIQSLFKRSAFDAAAPVEIYVGRELSNPHSRAKKQQRWQAFELYKRSLLDAMIKEEYKNLNGRTRKDARAEATFRWRQRLEAERKAEMKRRWVNRGAEARLVGRRARKAKKMERLRRKLRDLVLMPAPNQVIPAAAR